MKRAVNKAILDNWASENHPNANTKLHLLTGKKVPTNTIAKIRCGRCPVNSDYRRELAKALGTTEDVLFPVTEENAS